MKKKKVLFMSNFSKLKTGFGRHAKEILTHLYKTGKYEIVEYCLQVKHGDKALENMPWKCYGSIPNDDILSKVVGDPLVERAVKYGAYYIDDIIKEEQPDVFIGVEDIWAFNGFWDKPWWNKIPCLIWTTIDSLPLLDMAVDNAHKIKNYWVWTSFAEEAFKKQGFDHIKTVHGAIDTKEFYKLPDYIRNDVRSRNGIEPNINLYGFVFRNQIRKLVGSLIEGFAEYKKNHHNPNHPSKLLLHTSWTEGWDIKSFMKEHGVDEEDVLTTYVCNQCRDYHIAPFSGEGKDCKSCGAKGSCNTPKTYMGVTNSQLNEIYNVMDGYFHPMTSGGLEIPIVEALACGLPVATVPYSCGTEFTNNNFVFSLNHFEYREFGTQFIKAQSDPVSICETMRQMDLLDVNKGQARQVISQQGIDWAKSEFSSEKIGKEVEDFIDSQPDHSYSFTFDQGKHNADAVFEECPDLDNKEWLLSLIKEITYIEEKGNNAKVKSIIKDLDEGSLTRRDVFLKMIETAEAYNSETEVVNIDEMVTPSSNEKIVIVCPEYLTECVLTTVVIKEVQEDNPDADIYLCCRDQFKSLFEHLESVRFIPFHEKMKDPKWLGGAGQREPLFDKVIYPSIEKHTHN